MSYNNNILRIFKRMGMGRSVNKLDYLQWMILFRRQNVPNVKNPNIVCRDGKLLLRHYDPTAVWQRQYGWRQYVDGSMTPSRCRRPLFLMIPPLFRDLIIGPKLCHRARLLPSRRDSALAARARRGGSCSRRLRRTRRRSRNSPPGCWGWRGSEEPT